MKNYYYDAYSNKACTCADIKSFLESNYKDEIKHKMGTETIDIRTLRNWIRRGPSGGVPVSDSKKPKYYSYYHILCTLAENGIYQPLLDSSLKNQKKEILENMKKL